MVPDAAPADRGFSVQLDPLPRRAAVRVVHAPRQLSDTARTLERLDAHSLRPRTVLTGGRSLGGLVEPRHELAELALVVLREPLEVTVERGRRLELTQRQVRRGAPGGRRRSRASSCHRPPPAPRPRAHAPASAAPRTMPGRRERGHAGAVRSRRRRVRPPRPAHQARPFRRIAAMPQPTRSRPHRPLASPHQPKERPGDARDVPGPAPKGSASTRPSR